MAAVNRTADNTYHLEVFYNPDEAIVIPRHEEAWGEADVPPEWDVDDPGMGVTGPQIGFVPPIVGSG